MNGRGGFALDRMAIEEAGPNPERLAAAIHDQLDLPSCGPTPIREIAAALDIVEIREAPLTSFEAALIAPPERGEGMIVVNANSSDRRRRFSIAHELGHYLNERHRPIETNEGSGFACRKDDFKSWKPRSAHEYVHALQEAQANRFAIELLAPRKFFKGFLRGVPGLDAVVRLSASLKLSREAVARRYVELHEQPLAVAFMKAGIVRYIDRHPDFPALCVGRGTAAPLLPSTVGADSLSAHEEADWRDWLRRPTERDLVVQALHQDGGFAIALLALDSSRDDDER